MDARSRPRGTAVDDQTDDRSRRFDRRLLSEGRRSGCRRCRVGAGQFFESRAGPRSARGIRHRSAPAWRLFLLPAAVGRERVQAPEPVSALDGPARCARSRRVGARVSVEARHPARYACRSRRQVPATDAPDQPGLADGARHHPFAAQARCRRPGEVRFRALPPRDDECVRVQSPERSGASRFSMPASWPLPATRA